MSNEELPRDAEIDEISATLAEGLKSCRAMVASYRAMLGAEANDNFADGQPANDRSDWGAASRASADDDLSGRAD